MKPTIPDFWCYERWNGEWVVFQIHEPFSGHYEITDKVIVEEKKDEPKSNYAVFDFSNLSMKDPDHIHIINKRNYSNVLKIKKEEFYLKVEDAKSSQQHTAFQINTVGDYILAVDYYRYVSYLQYIEMIYRNSKSNDLKRIEEAVKAELQTIYECDISELQITINRSFESFIGILNTTDLMETYNVKTEIDRARSMYVNGGSFCYYRGVGHAYFPESPGIFRKDHLHEEARWYRMMKTNFYDQFDNLHYLDRLAMMQHYELPTRLLDVTSNPLVALYMAVNKIYSPDDADQQDYGEVIVYFDELTDTKSYDSNSVLVIAALAKLSFEEKESLSKFIDEAEKLIPSKAKSSCISEDTIKEIVNLCVHLSAEENNSDYYLAQHEKERIKQAIFVGFDKPSDIVGYLGISDVKVFHDFVNAYIHLLRTVRRENPAFSNKIDIFMLNRAFHVRVGMTNDRMRVQYGSFIIVGLDKDYIGEHMKSSRKPWIRRAFITNKSNIYRQLNALAINDMTMFPDMSHQAQYLKEQRY